MLIEKLISFVCSKFDIQNCLKNKNKIWKKILFRIIVVIFIDYGHHGVQIENFFVIVL